MEIRLEVDDNLYEQMIIAAEIDEVSVEDFLINCASEHMMIDPDIDPQTLEEALGILDDDESLGDFNYDKKCLGILDDDYE